MKLLNAAVKSLNEWTWFKVKYKYQQDGGLIISFIKILIKLIQAMERNVSLHNQNQILIFPFARK
jgi:hypothetical protein